jgi:hypothetical protein
MMMITGGVVCLGISGYIFMFLFKKPASKSDDEF